MPDITLQGISARGEGGQKLQRYFRDGTYAEHVRVPTENALPVGAIEPGDAGRWCALGTLLVAYGGLLAVDLRPGETLLVSGATGNFGSATVALALAMGARRVVALGRNTAVLEGLRQRFGHRLVPISLTGNSDLDAATLCSPALGSIDAVQGFLPPSADAAVARAAIMSLRQGGRAVLMGGVGMLGGEDLRLPYPWIMRNLITVRGQWMYDRAAVSGVLGLIRGGLLDLGQWDVTAFPLMAANDAVAHAAANPGPFKLAVLTP